MVFSDFAYCLVIVKDLDSYEASCYKEVISSKNTDDWVVTLNEELNSLQHNRT